MALVNILKLNEKGVESITKEKARQVTKALIDIEDFELFIEEIEKICCEFELVDFEPKLINFLTNELNNRKEILEKM